MLLVKSILVLLATVLVSKKRSLPCKQYYKQIISVVYTTDMWKLLILLKFTLIRLTVSLIYNIQ